jgi:hypothetical protein
LWQRNYFEHTIRDGASLGRIREYIINNPLQWELDRENPARPCAQTTGSGVWRVVHENLPELRGAIDRLLGDAPPGGGP